MAPTKVTLTNSGVNSGTAINLLAKDITTNWDIFTTVQDKPRTSTTSTINSSISKGYNAGFANPTHTVSGVYDLDSSHVSGANATIDFEYVLELIKNSQNNMTLTCDKFKTTSDSTGQRTVMLTSYNDNNPNTNTVEYTLEFIEVQS